MNPKNKYLEKATKLLEQTRFNLATTHCLELKNVFGAVGGYVNGHIFISCGKFGVALKLPRKIIEELFKERRVRRLKYFSKGHIKKEYAVIPKWIIEDKKQFKKLVDESIKYASSQE